MKDYRISDDRLKPFLLSLSGEGFNLMGSDEDVYGSDDRFMTKMNLLTGQTIVSTGQTIA